MSSWSICTRALTGTTKVSVYVNLDNVTLIEGAGENTIIRFIDAKSETVIEEPDVILNQRRERLSPLC
jgi:hypothetical protein